MFGEENPLHGETPVSWTTWSDGAGGAATVVGDADWGKVELCNPGEEARSQVYDLGDATPRIFTVTENFYGAGQGDATLQIRGDTDPFLQDDGEPPNWENYAAPITRAWRYIQVREIK